VNAATLVVVKVVNRPATSVVPPMTMLSIVPGVPGLIVTRPVPVGEITTFAFAGESATAAVTVRVPATLSVPDIVVAVEVIAIAVTVVAERVILRYAVVVPRSSEITL
jgi:hypothetical protein